MSFFFCFKQARNRTGETVDATVFAFTHPGVPTNGNELGDSLWDYHINF